PEPALHRPRDVGRLRQGPARARLSVEPLRGPGRQGRGRRPRQGPAADRGADAAAGQEEKEVRITVEALRMSDVEWAAGYRDWLPQHAGHVVSIVMSPSRLAMSCERCGSMVGPMSTIPPLAMTINDLQLDHRPAALYSADVT